MLCCFADALFNYSIKPGEVKPGKGVSSPFRREALAASCFVTHTSDFIPFAGIARALRTAFGTCSSGRACAAVFVQLTALFALPAKLFF